MNTKEIPDPKRMQEITAAHEIFQIKKAENEAAFGRQVAAILAHAPAKNGNSVPSEPEADNNLEPLMEQIKASKSATPSPSGPVPAVPPATGKPFTHLDAEKIPGVVVPNK